MKTKVKRLSKRTLAVFLGVLMLITSIGVGTLFTANAVSTVQIHTNADVSGNWVTTSLSGDGNHYTGTIYFKGKSSNYEMGMKIDGNWKVFGGYWINSGTTYNTAWGSGGSNNDQIPPISTSTTKYIKGSIEYYNEYSGNPWLKITQTELSALSTTVTVGANSLTSGSTTTIGKTNSGGSGSYTNTYKVRQGSASGTDVTSSTLSGTTFTAPTVSSSTTYYITTTVRDSNTNATATSTAKTITVNPASTTYTSISAAAKGSTDGSTFNTTLSGTPATISATSYTTGSSALNISAGTVSGYTFYKWVVTAGSGTIGSATTASTTFTPSASNTTVTAQYKKSYTISNNTPTGGSVALSKTSAVAGDSYTVTLTPNDGYKVKSLTLNGSAVTVSNNKYTGTASGTSDTLAFVATFEANTAMNLYIAGRFHVKNSSGTWVNTFDSGDWNATSTKIPFTYLSGTTYKVDTNATLAELSGKISNYDPVFFVYDTTNSKNWYASSATTMSTSGTTLVSSGGANNNLKFSSTSTDGPVTVYYDSNTHKIWYSIPDLYNVTVADATGGSVTASPSRTQENATVTLTITPLSGYQLSSITAKKGSTNVALSGTGNTRTFTMPAGDVTVTPVFSKIDYTLTKNSTSNGSFKLTNASGTEITKAQIGDTVKVVPTANTGYTVNTVKHGTTSSPSTSITASSGTYSFTMGAANEYVAVTFKEVTGTAVAKAYTSGSASSTGGTVKVGSGTAGASANATVGITTSATVVAAEKTNYSFTGWEKSGTNASHIKLYTDSACTTEYTSGATKTIYVKTDGSSGITTSNAEVRALFVPTDYTGLTVGAQYTENNSTYTDFATTPSGVTIGANHGTYQTGVAVTAPATDPEGYQFYQWYSANGTFANASNKDTTFKPNATGAKAIARYKKVFTITSSVDSSGTGAGTVSTSVDTVVAGGSYTITATAANGSAIESVKVNGTAKTATASQTISGVSADQDVKVKFKSNVYVRGGSTIGTNWTTGDAMTSNADGTEFTKTYENVAGSSSGTQYQFKLYVNGYNNDGTATINITGGTSTGTCTHQSSGDQNYVLTLKKAANVTIKSNGTKITEIKVVPANATKYAVTFKKADNVTITGQYEGTNFSTASADAVVQVYSGDEISFTVTPASGKYISTLTTSAGTLSPAFAAGDTYTGKLTNVTSARTVTPTAASKLNVVAKTNKSARGTVTVNKSTAAPGESITITVSPKNGVLKSLTCTYANGAVYTCNLSTKLWTKTTNANNAQAQRLVDGMAAFAFRDKVSKLMTSATAKLFSGANTTYTMTLDENSSATINATFDAYSGESTWYYNGYDTSGNAVSGYHGKQMTEGMVSGEKFSYYHVEGRTGTDQLMTVSDGVPSLGTRYVYFVRPNNYGDGWSASNNPKAHFWKYGGQDYDTWPGTEMSWQWNNDYGQGVYKIAIPDGADRVSFNDATNNGQHQTLDIDLTTTSGAYYVGEWNSTYSKYNYGTWDTGWADQGWVASGTEYFYQNSTHNGDYTGDFNTKGFYNHYTASKEFAKPKELGTNTGDYYINVLYPNTTYTINGVTKTTGSNPMIIWSAEPLAGDDETTTIYAKDGSIRSESYGSTYANIADTKIYLGNETVGTKHSGNITNQTYETYKAAKGDTIVIKTQIGATDSGTLSNAADLKAKYYVRGFCVNGEVTELLEWNADGLYTLTYKVPEDEELSKIEITPIYYLKDTTANPIVTYRVTGFTDELKAVGSGKPNWGNTLYTYPFYGKLGSNNNALGAYPGQPMVYYKGQYQMQIPQKSTAWDIYYDDGALSGYTGNANKANAVANTNVSGVTMSNGYYDLVHRQIAGFGDNSASADHVQTYDYGDFFKIFNEKKPVDNIVFDFKYRTKKHNFESQPAASTTKSTLDTNYGTNGNGFELLTNFHGRTVDLFGDPLSGDAANPSTTKPLYVVSIGGVNGSAGVENIAGYYATEWKVFAPNTTTGTPADNDAYKLVSISNGKSSIPPEVLVLNNNSTSFNNTTYPSADANHTLTDWKALYTALEAYRGKPVMISYEAADAQIGAGNYATSGSGGATRNDGRWLYSKNGENITGKIKIQYSDDNGANYTDLDTEDPQVTGLSAYFTNDGVEGEMTYATTIDPDKTFDFEAKTTNGNYKFVGWYMEDGTKITTDNASHTERSGSYTFVAKFMQVTTGQLILSHSVDTNATYKGAGTAKIGVVVKNGDEVVRTYDLSTSDITLDDKIIKSDNSDYTIEVTLEATATGNDTYGTTVLANPSGQEAKFYKNPSTTTVDKTNTIVLDSFTVGDLFTNGTTQNVKNIIYHSYFNEAVFNYNFKFTFKDRFGNDKTYYRIGKLTSAQASNTDYVETSGTTKYLKPAFYSKLAPYESNFGKNFSWGDMSANKSFTNSGNVWTCEATITSTQTDNNARTATFKLPYAHTNGVPSNLNIMNKADSVNYSINVTYGDVVKKGTEDYVVAPRQLNDNGTIKNFQYWSVVSTSNTEKEVARCYFYSFNFVAYDNYEITPVYDTGATPLTNGNGDTPLTTISYLSTTRNQYTGNGTDTAPVNANARDVLFNDFVLSYEYNGLEIFKNDNTSSAVTDLGYVVERVQKLEIQQDGSPYVDPAHYSAKSISVKTDSEIKNFIKSGNTKSGTLTKHQILKDSLDNKNRIEFAETYDNSIGWNSETQKPDRTSGFKNYVYKAYTYMIVNGEVTLSDPAYFTMYDEAKK